LAPGGDWRRRLHLLGHRTDVPEWLPGLDGFCVSSVYGEGFPNAAGEAMACGLTGVVTDVGDLASLVGDTGTVVPVRDPRALIDGIERWLALGADGRRALGASARERIASLFEIGRVTRQYETLYEELLHG
jgi:glycosyltransferase involved in cell wall biosynthesis